MTDEATTGAAPSRRRSTGSRAGRALRELVVVVVVGLVLSTLLRTFVVQMFVIPSQSMENTLLIGDRVAVQKLVPYQRGDIVVFEDPSNWLPPVDTQERTGATGFLEFVGILPDSSQNYLIKRVIGTPGDVVVCCDSDGRVTVNGRPLDEQNYLYSDNGELVDPSDYRFRVTVPADRIFVMGDHRNASADSRCHLTDPDDNGGVRGAPAFVPTDRIVGVAFAVVAPLDRIRPLTRDATYDAVPAAAQPAPAQPAITIDGAAC